LEREALDLLARTGVPQPDLDLPPEEEARLRVAAAAALEDIVATAPRRGLSWPSVLRWRWPGLSPHAGGHHRWLVAVVPAAALVVVAAVVAAVALSGRLTPAVAVTPPMPDFSSVQYGTVPLTGEDAVPMLSHLAERAATQPDEPVVGDVQLVQTAGWWIETNPETGKAEARGGLVAHSSDLYGLPDGTLRLIERFGPLLDLEDGFVDPGGEWVNVADESFDGGEVGPEYPETFSTDPQTLIGQVIPDPAECLGTALCLVLEMESLHRRWVVQPVLRSAFWSALAQTEGVWYLGQTRDRLGRPAVAFAVMGAGKDRQTIVYADQDAGEFLGIEYLLIEDNEELGLEAPAVIEFWALVDSRWVEQSEVPEFSKDHRQY
jgi:hypothetical protein